MIMLINLTNGGVIFARDERYVSPAPVGQKVCGKLAPKWPHYKCTREAGHEAIDDKLLNTHAAHGNHRGGMFAVWQEESKVEEVEL